MRPTAWAWLVALLGWTTLLCFYRLDGGANFEPIDCWVAQTAREMSEREFPRNLLVPVFSGETRMQKSPGPYWAVMASAWLRGETDIEEVSARIPNALAAILLVATIFWLAHRIAGERAAVFAGFAAAASVLVLWWSHRGASDLGLTTFTTLSLAALWIAAETEPPGGRRNALFLLGFFAAGLGMLYKMPMPLAIVGAPVFFYLLLRNRWRILANRWHLLGLLLFLLPWLPWAVAVCAVEDAALVKWKVEFFDRFTGRLPNVDGQGGMRNLPYYLPVPLLYCLPFTLSLPMALRRAFDRTLGINRDGTLFMLIWFVSLFAFFTASTGKEYRYLLPALPPLFVLLGIELARFFDPRRPASPTGLRLGLIATWVVTPLSFVAIGFFVLRPWWFQRGQFELGEAYAFRDVLGVYVVAATVICVGVAVSAWLYSRRARNASFAALVATMWLMWFYAWPNVMPYFLSQSPFTDFAAQLQQKVPAELRPRLRQIANQDPRIIWFSDIRFPRLIDQLKLLTEQQRRYAAGEQASRRDIEYEKNRYGEEMVAGLGGDDPVLYVASFYDYLMFINAAPDRLKDAGRPLPPLHLWLQTRRGRENRHFVLFGNRPPPFPEPDLRLMDPVREQLAEKGYVTAWPRLDAATQSATQPASRSVGGR